MTHLSYVIMYTLPPLIRTRKAEKKLESGSKSGLKKHINIGYIGYEPKGNLEKSGLSGLVVSGLTGVECSKDK